MTQEYGVRITSFGPNRTRVISLIRGRLKVSPKSALEAALSGEPVVVGEQFTRRDALQINTGLKELGASSELFITSGPDHFAR